MGIFALIMMLLLCAGQGGFDAPASGTKIRVAARDYSLRFLDDASIGNVERSDKVCLWKNGTAWVIDPHHPTLSDRFTCQWPIVTLSEDRRLAVVELTGSKDLRVGVADLRKKALVVEFPEDEYLGGTFRWVFSKNQRVYALDGATRGGLHYIDLEQKKCLHFKIPGLTTRKGTYSWGGTLLPGGKEIVLFVSGTLEIDGKRRIQFPIDDFDRRQITVLESSLTLPIIPMAEELQLGFANGKYAIVDTSTWKLVKKIDWGGERSIPTTMILGPGRKNAYLIDYPEGLIIFEPQSGRPLKKMPQATATRQITFSSDSRYCVVCTEKSEILVLDTMDHRVVDRAPLKRLAMMAFLVEPSGKETIGTCLVVPRGKSGEVSRE